MPPKPKNKISSGSKNKPAKIKIKKAIQVKLTPVWYVSLIHFFTVIFWITLIYFCISRYISGLFVSAFSAILGIWLGNISAAKYLNQIHRIKNKLAPIKLSSVFFLIFQLISLYGYFFHLRYRVNLGNIYDVFATTLLIIFQVVVYYYFTDKYLNKIAYPVLRPWGKLLKYLLITARAFLILIVFILLIPSVLDNFTRDALPPNDSHLKLKKISIQKEDNSFYDLEKNFEFAFPKDEFALYQNYIEKEEWDGEKVKTALLKVEPALINFDSAAAKKYYQDPALADPAMLDFLNLPVRPSNGLRAVTRLSLLKAAAFAKNGQEKEAFEQCFATLAVARQLQESQGSFIQYLVSLAMKKTSFETIQKLSETSNLPSEILTSYALRLKEFGNSKEGLISALKFDYWGRLWAINATTKNGQLDSFYIRPNKTKSYAFEAVEKQLLNLNGPCQDLKEEETRRRMISYELFYFTENAIGKSLADIGEIAIGSALKKRCGDDSLLGQAMVALARRAYENQLGSKPASLNDLVPDYLQEIPIDPMTGKPFKYPTQAELIK